MVFLINWLNAIGALLLFLIVYSGVPEYSLPAAIFVALFAMIFPTLSFRLRAKADPYLKFNPVLAGIGTLIVFGLIGGATYLSVMMWGDVATAGKVFLAALSVPALFMLIESVLTLIDDDKAMLEDKINHAH